MKTKFFKRECGTCTSCCNTLAVVEVGKAAGEYCRHAKQGAGCTLAAAKRPYICRRFHCAWLTGDVDVRPFREGAVCDQLNDGTLVVKVTNHELVQKSATWEIVKQRIRDDLPMRIVDVHGRLIWASTKVPAPLTPIRRTG